MKVALFRECYGEGGAHLPHRPTPALTPADRATLVEFLSGELLLARRILLMLKETDSATEWGVGAKDHSRSLLVEMLGRAVPPRKNEEAQDYEARLLRIAEKIRHRAAGEE